jgi:hypothetical protein
MNAEQFVAGWRREKEALLKQFTDHASGSEVVRLMSQAKLSALQSELVAKALDAALTDAFYTLLLGLDGAASIGGVQTSHQLCDDKGVAVAKPGELEAAAWEHFHGK